MTASILELPEKILQELISAYFTRQAKEWARLKRQYSMALGAKENFEINIFVFSLIPDIVNIYLRFLRGKLTKEGLRSKLIPPLLKLLRLKNPEMTGREDLKWAILSKVIHILSIFEFDKDREEIIKFLDRALISAPLEISPTTVFQDDKNYERFLKNKIPAGEYRAKLEMLFTSSSVKRSAYIIFQSEKILSLDGRETSRVMIRPEEFSKRMEAWNETINFRILEVYYPRNK